MAQARDTATGCVLPSGRFAVLGGYCTANVNTMDDAEAFDPVSRAWEPLPPMPRRLVGGASVAVAGGLLVAGGVNHAGAMLFDEESGRWFTLPR
jgi:N-acetylneuraminic acid mutarotase